MNSNQLLKIVEQYSRKSGDNYGDIKVTRISDQKTVFVEHLDEIGRAIIMAMFKVDGETYWAGYSALSHTVYISMEA
ncbi:MAG: hypothetical protein CVU39_24305 [Chloroflexi bacterium HGW-Chloroflexi-10]|nr:MAG: hypothetical protein CVU39_24305 [Chloroflexi bacterium HGW-Chloroflexi-10]